MEYEFSLGSFIVGFIVIVVGVAFVKWHQKIADSLGSGVASYDRYRLWAFITCGFGLLLMFNIPTLVLRAIASFFIPNL